MLGAGAWGTALANVLAENGADVALWARDAGLVTRMRRERENPTYLPGVPLHPRVAPVTDVRACVGCALVLSAVPSHGVREVVGRAAPSFSHGVLLVSATKGIENRTLLRVSEIFAEVVPRETAARVGALSGPSFAREVSERRPTAVTLASARAAAAAEARDWFVRPHLRVYTSTDVVGVELGGALKNVVAIAAGIAEGLGAGHNGRAALITRGMAELVRLARALGGDPLTLSGLAGMGDLILTCTSAVSRNYRVGLRLAQGEPLGAVVRSMREVAEGVRTSESAFQLARREDVEMPIVNEVYAILHQGKSPAEALDDLMAREMKEEFWE